MIIGCSSPSDGVSPVDAACKRTNEQPAAPATDSSPRQVRWRRRRRIVRSFVMGLPVQAEGEPLSLGELFSLVRDMGGKIVRSKDGGFAVQGVEKPRLTPAILTALEAHHCELDLIVPSPVPPPPVEIGGQDTVKPISPVTDDTQAPEAADSPRRCVKCGDAVVGSSDEYCHPCFLAEIQSLSPEPE